MRNESSLRYIRCHVGACHPGSYWLCPDLRDRRIFSGPVAWRCPFPNAPDIRYRAACHLCFTDDPRARIYRRVISLAGYGANDCHHCAVHLRHVSGAENTYTGLLGVEQKYLEAAKGCGMSQLQSLLRVELPLAMPSIIAGLRMSAIYTVSWAVLAAMIGLGGLGGFVYQGTSSNNNTLILLGAIPSALLAVVIGAFVDLLQKRVTPKELRKEGN